MKEVAREAFSGCKRLKRLCFASGAWQLAPMTFQNCTGLEEIAFPDTLEKMSERVFEGCSALRPDLHSGRNERDKRRRF